MNLSPGIKLMHSIHTHNITGFGGTNEINLVDAVSYLQHFNQHQDQTLVCLYLHILTSCLRLKVQVISIVEGKNRFFEHFLAAGRKIILHNWLINMGLQRCCVQMQFLL